MAKYLDWQRIPALFSRVELGVTGDVVVFEGDVVRPSKEEGPFRCPLECVSRYERVIVRGYEDQELWLETHIGVDGQLTGDWDAVFERDALALGLWRP